MEKESEFLIPVSGLALGVHNYRFDINDDFFVDLDYSEVKHGRVTVDLEVLREELMMTLNFHLEGEVLVPCDRCADEFYIPIQSEQVFYIKLGAEGVEESEDVAVVPAEEHAYDVRSLNTSSSPSRSIAFIPKVNVIRKCWHCFLTTKNPSRRRESKRIPGGRL